MKKILGLFPGQGSQKVGMGSDLIDKFDLAKEIFAIVDQCLGFSLSNICREGPVEALQKTEIAQPAILTVSTICFRILEKLYGSPIVLTIAAGHSLGEYSALVAANAISFEDAVVLVNKRGRYMQEAVPVGMGKMVAVLGLELAELENKIAKYDGKVQIANINTPGQIVVAGETCSVSQLTEDLAEVKTVELPVSAPFHCSLMKPAEDNLRQDLQSLIIASPKFPVISNVSAQPLTDPEQIREALVKQVCGRVRWVESIKNAVATYSPDMAIEFGTGNILTGMLKRIDGSLTKLNANSIETIEKIAAQLNPMA